MRTLARIFLQGLLVFVPVVGTVALISWALITLDRLLQMSTPGLGIALTVAVVLVLGLLADNVVGRRLFGWFESAFVRVPVVKIVYTSLKDLLDAFVGDKRSFNRPVMVRFEHDVRAFGFLTRDHFDDPRLDGHVAVYLPWSYNMSGRLVVVPESRVEPVDADAAEFLAFVVSAGIAAPRPRSRKPPERG